mgnify:CR=1 FL=1
MSNIKIVIFSGSYNNWDVYENVLSYVASKENPSGYGFWGNTVQDYANQFQTSCSLSSQEEDQNIWHFCISSRFFSSNKYSSLALANQIAQIFKDHFQIMYAYDGKKTNHPYTFCCKCVQLLSNCTCLDESTLYFLSRKSKAASKERIPEYRSANFI